MKHKDQIKMRSLPVAVLLLALPAAAGAQTVVASGGGEGAGGGHSLSWTIGEPVTKTVTAGNRTLTQGFQQPWADVATVVGEQSASTMDIRAYPNPADRVLNVEVPAASGPLHLELFDAAGRIVLQAPATGTLTQLDLTGQSTGHYILRALDQQGIPAKTFKININH